MNLILRGRKEEGASLVFCPIHHLILVYLKALLAHGSPCESSLALHSRDSDLKSLKIVLAPLVSVSIDLTSAFVQVFILDVILPQL